MSPPRQDPGSKRRRGGPTEAELLAAKRVVSNAERRAVKEAEQLCRDARRMLELASVDAERRRTEAERVLAESRAEAERVLAASRAEAERIRAEAIETAEAAIGRTGDVGHPGQLPRKRARPEGDRDDRFRAAGQSGASAEQPGVEEAERLCQEARRLLEAASADAERRRAEAERVLAESQAEAQRVLAEAGRVLADAQAEAERTLAEASEAAPATPGTGLALDAGPVDDAVEARRCQAALEAGNLIAVLRRLLRVDPSTEVRLGAVRALARTSELEQVGCLGLALADSEPAVRIAALEWFSVAGTRRSANYLAAAAADDDRSVRAAAHLRLVAASSATLWTALRPDKHRPELLAVLEEEAPHRLKALGLAGMHSPRDTDRLLALEVIGRLGAPLLLSQAVPALVDREPAVRRTAATLLRGHGPATPALLTALMDDPEPQVRRETGRSLADLGTEPVLVAFERALHDPDAEVRRTALDALSRHRSVGRLGGPAGVTTSPLDSVGKALSRRVADDERKSRDGRAGTDDTVGRSPPAWPLGLAQERAVAILDMAGAVLTASLLFMAALGMTGPGRVLLAVMFVTFVPGWAVLGHLPVVHGTSRIALAMALSLTICTGLAQALLWLRLWNPSVMLALVGSISLAVLATKLARPRLGRVHLGYD